MGERRLKHFGWGREGEGMTEAEEALRILAKNRGGKIVTVYVRVDGYDIQYQQE